MYERSFAHFLRRFVGSTRFENLAECALCNRHQCLQFLLYWIQFLIQDLFTRLSWIILGVIIVTTVVGIPALGATITEAAYTTDNEQNRCYHAYSASVNFVVVSVGYVVIILSQGKKICK